MRYRVLPYRQGSRSASALAEALGGRVLRLAGSTFRARRGDVIINWGNADFPRVPFAQAEVYNETGLRTASNKKTFFESMPEGLCPQFWTRMEDIPDEAFADGGQVVCRTVLAGHSGAGIVIASNRGELVRCNLYVKYIKKQDEYRIHVGMIGERNGYPYAEGGDVPRPVTISVQRKARREGHENPNWQVRNLAGGFVFVRQGVTPPGACIEAAHNSLRASGLDFGAVDVIWNARQERAYVLEINTAPGLEGTTVTDYANFFRGTGAGA